MDNIEAKKIVEALIFAAERSLSINQIREVLENVGAEKIKAIVEELNREYSAQQRSFTIKEVAGGYIHSTKPEFAPWLGKLYQKTRSEKLSRPALESLAIVAYRQPITRVEIEDIRGVNVDGVIRKLLEKSLIKICGRKELPGRPFCYGTTNEFLELFGLKSLENLPKLEEFGELMKAGDANVEISNITQEDRSDR